jgi:hypothetical protein
MKTARAQSKRKGDRLLFQSSLSPFLPIRGVPRHDWTLFVSRELPGNQFYRL